MKDNQEWICSRDSDFWFGTVAVALMPDGERITIAATGDKGRVKFQGVTTSVTADTVEGVIDRLIRQWDKEKTDKNGPYRCYHEYAAKYAYASGYYN